jgi:hypothetical protein
VPVVNIVFDPVINELIKGQGAGHHKPPEEFFKKTELIILGYKIKSLPEYQDQMQ